MNFIQIPLHSPEKYILINIDKIDYVREFVRSETCIVCISSHEFEVKVSYEKLTNDLVNLAK